MFDNDQQKPSAPNNIYPNPISQPSEIIPVNKPLPGVLQSKKKRNSKIAIILLIIVIASAGLVIWRLNISKNVPTSLSEHSQKTSIKRETVIAEIDTANWLEAKDESLHYSFMYPSNSDNITWEKSDKKQSDGGFRVGIRAVNASGVKAWYAFDLTIAKPDSLYDDSKDFDKRVAELQKTPTAVIDIQEVVKNKVAGKCLYMNSKERGDKSPYWDSIECRFSYNNLSYSLNANESSSSELKELGVSTNNIKIRLTGEKILESFKFVK